MLKKNPENSWKFQVNRKHFFVHLSHSKLHDLFYFQVLSSNFKNVWKKWKNRITLFNLQENFEDTWFHTYWCPARFQYQNDVRFVHHKCDGPTGTGVIYSSAGRGFTPCFMVSVVQFLVFFATFCWPVFYGECCSGTEHSFYTKIGVNA
jgi:hypothetical protein